MPGQWHCTPHWHRLLNSLVFSSSPLVFYPDHAFPSCWGSFLPVYLMAVGEHRPELAVPHPQEGACWLCCRGSTRASTPDQGRAQSGFATRHPTRTGPRRPGAAAGDDCCGHRPPPCRRPGHPPLRQSRTGQRPPPPARSCPLPLRAVWLCSDLPDHGTKGHRGLRAAPAPSRSSLRVCFRLSLGFSPQTPPKRPGNPSYFRHRQKPRPSPSPPPPRLSPGRSPRGQARGGRAPSLLPVLSRPGSRGGSACATTSPSHSPGPRRAPVPHPAPVFHRATAALTAAAAPGRGRAGGAATP